MTSKFNELNKSRHRVGRSFAGFGLFATDSFKKGEKIIEYVGLRLTAKQADEVKVNRYHFELNNRYTLDGRPRWNTARYANHSCKPNAEANIIKGKIYIVAIKNIKPGDEITYDYGKEYLDEYIKREDCLCPPCLKTT